MATLLKEIDDNIDQLMKEKAEYHKSGMKSTKGSFFAGGQFDTKSHACLLQESAERQMIQHITTTRAINKELKR